VQRCHDAAVLARVELVPFVDGELEIAFRDLQLRGERAGVLDLVDVDVDGAGRRMQMGGGVVHVVPAGGVVQGADHVDAVGRQHEVAVVEIVLLWREQRDRGAGLLPWGGGLLRDGGADGGENGENGGENAVTYHAE
jgi:hypothetical protein